MASTPPYKLASETVFELPAFLSLAVLPALRKLPVADKVTVSPATIPLACSVAAMLAPVVLTVAVVNPS